MRFDELDLEEAVLDGLDAMNFQDTTPVQELTIPVILEGKDIITDPKTVKSNRMITMPEFLSEELESYIGMLYGLNENDRIFQISKSYLHHEMDRGVKLSGVKRIRIHDLRHSHVSLLINMGYSAVAIGERVGHESVEITYQYAHLFPTIQTEMAENLNQEREEYLDE